MQMNKEDRFMSFAKLRATDKPLVMLCDKGVLESYAWVDDILW